jgi:hypothetical protein
MEHYALDPVLVTVEPPRTAKLCAEPREGAVCADAGTAWQRSPTNPSVISLYVRIIGSIVFHSPFDPRRSYLLSDAVTVQFGTVSADAAS